MLKRKFGKFAIVPALALLLSSVFGLAVPSVSAQEDVGVVVVDPDTDMQLQILENEIAQLRRKLRLRRMKDVQKSKEWQQAYNETAQDIKEWQQFANKYLSGK